MTNSGQVCDAGSKLYIHETIYDQLIEKIIAINKSIVIGNAFEDERVNLGPLINKRYLNICNEQIIVECVGVHQPRNRN
jgi:phenylacetaldehyde dehydrogenase